MHLHFFQLTSPPMRGAEHLQRAVNHHLAAWGAPKEALLRVDGRYGPHTRVRAHEVAFGLGIEGRWWHHKFSPTAQRKVEHHSLLSPSEHAVLQQRTAWRHRFIRRLHDANAGINHAVEFAHHMAKKEIVEHPPGSNLGPYITSWERLAGYNVPVNGQGVSWCGCWVNAFLVAGGFHTQASWGIGYVPFIEAHAKAGIDGWRWHPASADPKKGFIATFGATVGEHTEAVVDSGWPLRTVGGNTSKGNGSPNEGGGLYYHNFRFYHGLPLRGFAVPPWHHH